MEQSVMYESLAQVNLSAYRGRIETSGGRELPRPPHRILTVEGYVVASRSKVRRSSGATLVNQLCGL